MLSRALSDKVDYPMTRLHTLKSLHGREDKASLA